MKPLSHRTTPLLSKLPACAILSALTLSVFLPSCALTGPHHRAIIEVSGGEGYYESLPVDLDTDYYYYNNRYYYGGVWEKGPFRFNGHVHEGRYFHSGNYLYGGQYRLAHSKPPASKHHDNDRGHERHS